MIKKSLSLLLMLSIVLSIVGASVADAETLDYSNKYIRVGLEKNLGTKSHISLNGEGFIVALENENATELFEIQDSIVSVKAKPFSHHVEIKEVFETYDLAQKTAKELISRGEDAYVSYKDGFKVYIGEFTSESSSMKSLEKVCNDMEIDALIAKNETMISILSKDGTKIISFDKNDNLAIKSKGETTLVDKKKFRGFLCFSANKTNIQTINFIKLDDYLRGVVPREMSGSWNIEALKAQAVSARNYTLRNINKHKSLGFDICDSTHCQVYEGFDKEHTNSNKAIDETKNKLLRYNDEIAQTFYYSSSGGYTSSNENVWGGSAIPYLRGKKDPFSLNAPNSDWTYSISKGEASKKLKANSLDVGEILYFEFKKDEFNARVIELRVIGTKGEKVIEKEKVRNIFGTSNVKSTNYTIVGQEETMPEKPVPTPPVIIPPVITPPVPPVDVPPVEKPVDTPIEAYILDSDKTYRGNIGEKNVISADGITTLDKKIENIVLSDGFESIVRKSINDYMRVASTRITYLGEEKNTKSPVGDTITFKGSGWGHGVGMSQYGALNMAKLGHSYIEILEFYYSGAHVE